MSGASSCIVVSPSQTEPVWREVLISSIRNRFSRHCCEETFPQRAEDVSNSCAQHSFLSVMFVDQGAVWVVCAAWCVECSSRMYQKRDQLLFFARVYFSADFVMSTTPMPLSLRSHRQVRRRGAHEDEFCGRTPAWRRLVPISFRWLFCCAEKDRFSPLTCSCPAAREAAYPPGILIPFP